MWLVLNKSYFAGDGEIGFRPGSRPITDCAGPSLLTCDDTIRKVNGVYVGFWQLIEPREMQFANLESWGLGGNQNRESRKLMLYPHADVVTRDHIARTYGENHLMITIVVVFLLS